MLMNEVNVYTTAVFNANYAQYKKGVRLIINEGGSRSSKTYSILQLLFYIAYNSEKPLIISIVSRTLPHLKLGAMRDFESVLNDAGVNVDKIKNVSNSYYKINKSTVEFFGVEQLDKVHGPSRDILFINEANFIKYSIYTQLAMRTSDTIFIDYNPVSKFWVNDEIFGKEKHSLIHSTYQNNHLLPEGIKLFLDSKLKRYNEEKAAGTITKAFENYCNIYLFGKLGSVEGTIFENWRYEDDGEIDKAYRELTFSYGLDYGFYPDPDAMVKVAIDKGRKIIYVTELFYTTNNGTDDLVKDIQRCTLPNELIIAESATPRTNEDIRRRGLNIRPVQKTRTVVEWLREIQDYEIVISKESVNLERELCYYVWSDKKAGVPIDAWNHLLDALRYNYMMTMSFRVRSKIKSV